jgi:putative ABC transport system permease protein
VSRVPGVDRAVGTAAGSTLALALLVCGCVFAALAGPALNLHTQSQALHQTLAGLSPDTTALQVTGDWLDFSGSTAQAQAGGATPNLTEAQITRSTSEIGRGLAATPLPLAAGAWAGLNSKIMTVGAGAAPSAMDNASQPPKLEVVYRDPLTTNARLVAGTFATGAVPAGAVGVAATTQTAARFGLHPGSRLQVVTPSGPIALQVTAIVTQRDAASTFWTEDSTVAAPSLNDQDTLKAFWSGGVFADPGQLGALQDAFSGPGLQLLWEFPLTVSGLTADRVRALYDELNRATATTPTLTGNLAPSADALSVSSPLLSNLSAFLGTQAGIQTVLVLLFVSLIVIAAAVILLAARMVVLRRDGELTMLRARGGSLRQVTAVMARGALIAAGPAALIGCLLAIALIPGGVNGPAASPLGWSLAGFAVAVALAGPPLIAAWQYRRPAPASNPARITTAETGRRKKAWRRPVAEVTACAGSVAGLVVLHNQGVPAGGRINLFLAIAPVLVAIPVVVVMLRLYPLAVRGLLALSARRAGATGFVALSRAARSSLGGALPAFGLVLALSLATFAGMLSEGITRGETAAAWHTTGADVLINTGISAGPVTPAAMSAIAAVHGVRHATAVWSTNWVSPGFQPVTVLAVEPASYAALVASTPFPSFPVATIGTAYGSAVPPGAVVPVLASPAAAAILGPGATELTSIAPMGPVTVRVAGLLGSTPAQPGGGAFVVMPIRVLPGPYGQPAPNVILVAGSAIDDSQLSAVVNKLLPAATVTFRSAVLASLSSSPLQHGASLVVVVVVVAAAALGLFIVILGLALGSAERDLTLARLAVMGHERDTSLVMTEALPAVVAAIVAGAVCAAVLPRLIGSSVDLSAFTGTGAPVQFQADLAALGLPAATALLLAVAALIAEAKASRRRDITGILRAE